MSHHWEIARRLREKGYRLTPQRLAVLEVIKAGPGHMTVNEVLEHLRPQYPTITIPTVYRNLQWLKQAELVAETDLGGEGHVYEYIADHPHHHLVCIHCKRVIDLPDSCLDPVFKSVCTRYGFQPAMKHTAIFGVCPDCQKHEEGEQRQSS